MNMVPPRAKKETTRSRRLVVRVSEEEHSRIHANAKSARLRLSEYLRRIALEGQIVVRQQTAYGASLVFQLKRIGVNLNQLMPYVHEEGKVPPEMRSLWTKIEALLDKVLRED